MGSWAIWTKTFQNGWEPHRNAATTDEYEYRTHLCINATVAQRPRLTCVLTHGTHGDIDGFTNLFTDETMNQDMTATIKNTHVLNYIDINTRDLEWIAGCLNWPDLAGVHREETIEEDENANQGRRDQHASVPAQPCKVKTDFLTKVPPGRDRVVRIHQ